MSLLTGFSISLDEVGLLGQASQAAFVGGTIPAGWKVVTPAQLGLGSQYSDRDYFTEARAQTGDQLHASIQVQNRIDGTRTIVFARRLESASGNFAGIVFAGVNAKHFEEIYGSIQSVQNRLFTLLKSDGTILVRYPQGQEFAGKKLSTEAHRLDSLARDGGGFRVLAQTDGKARFVELQLPIYRKLQELADVMLVERLLGPVEGHDDEELGGGHFNDDARSRPVRGWLDRSQPPNPLCSAGGAAEQRVGTGTATPEVSESQVTVCIECEGTMQAADGPWVPARQHHVALACV